MSTNHDLILPNNPDNKPRPPNWEREIARRTLKKATKRVKNNHDSKPRRKEWLGNTSDDDDSVPTTASERIMPRGERERRAKVLQLATQIARDELAQWSGASSDSAGAAALPEGLPGVVVEVSSGLCRVSVDSGSTLLCTLRGSLSELETGYTNMVAVGDHVIVSQITGQTDTQNGVVEAILPRRSVLARPDVYNSHLRQAIVANVDQLLIVASWREPNLWLELIDRYVITAERDNLIPILCVNKIDLAQDREAVIDLLEPYIDLDVEILYVSARTGEGIDLLRDRLTGRSSVVAGLSGVGKSSLLAVVQPGLNLKVGSVSEYDLMGRHTTTQANLYRLEAGGYVVDTPGIREFGLSGMVRSELVAYYPEIEELASECRFGNCTHTHEPGCAVRKGAQYGALPQWRYQNYIKLLGTLPE